MILKISPSTLEEFRCYRAGLFRYDREKEGDHAALFIEYLTRKFEKTEPMSLGSAFHLMVEDGPGSFRVPDCVIFPAGEVENLFTLVEKTIEKFSDTAKNFTLDALNSAARTLLAYSCFKKPEDIIPVLRRLCDSAQGNGLPVDDLAAVWYANPDHYSGPFIHSVYEEELNLVWEFDHRVAECVDLFRNKYKPIAHEIWGELKSKVKGYEIVSKLKLDGVNGTIIHEMKTTTSTFPVSREDYEDSAQWRMYLLASDGSREVLYTKFKLKPDKHNPRRMVDVEPVQFSFHPYDGMREYIDSLMFELINFLEANNIINLVAVK